MAKSASRVDQTQRGSQWVDGRRNDAVAGQRGVVAQPAQRNGAAAHDGAVAGGIAPGVFPCAARRLECSRVLVPPDHFAGQVPHSCAVGPRPVLEATLEVLCVERVELRAGLGEDDRLCQIVVVGRAGLNLDFADAVGIGLAQLGDRPAELEGQAEQVADGEADHHAACALA